MLVTELLIRVTPLEDGIVQRRS